MVTDFIGWQSALKMKTQRAIPIWVGFALTSALSLASYYRLSALHSYLLISTSLSIVNLFLGCWVIYVEGRTPRVIIFVIAGLIIGQWWVIVWSVVFLIWHVRGFAP